MRPTVDGGIFREIHEMSDFGDTGGADIINASECDYATTPLKNFKCTFTFQGLAIGKHAGLIKIHFNGARLLWFMLARRC